jgi:hypothetical protein
MTSHRNTDRRSNMSQPSRNIFKPAQALLLGISATLLGAVSHAADDTRFKLTAYTDAVGGREILSGDYQLALTRIAQTHVSDLTKSAVELNRCVALTMTQQWEEARHACDNAVADAEHRRVVPTGALEERRLQEDSMAIAYSNRAVLDWLVADAEAAKSDLARAKALSPDSDIVASNTMAFGAHTVVAQVTGTTVR